MRRIRTVERLNANGHWQLLTMCHPPTGDFVSTIDRGAQPAPVVLAGAENLEILATVFGGASIGPEPQFETLTCRGGKVSPRVFHGSKEAAREAHTAICEVVFGEDFVNLPRQTIIAPECLVN